MKDLLINIINSYAKNSRLNDFNLLLTINNYLSLDDTVIAKVDSIDDCVRVVLKYDYNLLGVVFYNDGDLGVTLPFSGLFIIKSSNSNNMNYDEIKNLLIKKGTVK